MKFVTNKLVPQYVFHRVEVLHHFQRHSQLVYISSPLPVSVRSGSRTQKYQKLNKLFPSLNMIDQDAMSNKDPQ